MKELENDESQFINFLKSSFHSWDIFIVSFGLLIVGQWFIHIYW